MTIVFTLRGRLYSDTLCTWTGGTDGMEIYSEVGKCFFTYQQFPNLLWDGHRILGYYATGDITKSIQLFHLLRSLLEGRIQVQPGSLDGFLDVARRFSSVVNRSSDSASLVLWTVRPESGELLIRDCRHHQSFSYSKSWRGAEGLNVWGSGRDINIHLEESDLARHIDDPNGPVTPQLIFQLAASYGDGCGGRLQELDHLNGVIINHPYLTRADIERNDRIVSQHVNAFPRYNNTTVSPDGGYIRHVPALYHDLSNTYSWS